MRVLRSSGEELEGGRHPGGGRLGGRPGVGGRRRRSAATWLAARVAITALSRAGDTTETQHLTRSCPAVCPYGPGTPTCRWLASSACWWWSVPAAEPCTRTSASRRRRPSSAPAATTRCSGPSGGTKGWPMTTGRRGRCSLHCAAGPVPPASRCQPAGRARPAESSVLLPPAPACAAGRPWIQPRLQPPCPGLRPRHRRHRHRPRRRHRRRRRHLDVR